ncbi:hypothetical protein RUM44_009244 [Polyplax serrata]|uniref:Uncharacterized protein n=1 Tax=Polyplax serrata TaxID=468196 RepID=A0ABR1AS48_POLSC
MAVDDPTLSKYTKEVVIEQRTPAAFLVRLQLPFNIEKLLLGIYSSRDLIVSRQDSTKTSGSTVPGRRRLANLRYL